MPQITLETLTPEQEALIPVYRNKWRKIALSTEPIDKQKATEAVKAAYNLIRSPEPEIVFFDSPHAALKLILERDLLNQPYSQLWSQLRNQLCKEIYKQIGKPLRQNLSLLLDSQLDSVWSEANVWSPPLENPDPYVGGMHYFRERMNQYCHSFIIPEFWACTSSWFDFCISVLNCDYDPKKWELYQSLIKNSGWLFSYPEICIVCYRPRILSFNHQGQLHAEGSPAMQFSDGYSVYAHEGAILPDN
ncbi:MAG TPA: hypothetical protein V6C95_07550 [Coleofasciculaceae cyanobacterium]